MVIDRSKSNKHTKHKVGDLVRVRPLDEILSQCKDGLLGGNRSLPSGCWFARSMEKYCGEEFTVIAITLVNSNNVAYYLLDGASHWSFTDEMLEDPVDICSEVAFDSGSAISFDDLMTGNCDS